MSGVGPSSRTSDRTAAARKSRREGSSNGSASTSATARTGFATTGPTPGLISMSRPATTSGRTMSEKRIAASTPCRRTGCSVISVTRSGSWHASSIAVPARSARYSGSERPAWRMNHTGVRSTGSPRAARTRAESAAAPLSETEVTSVDPPRPVSAHPSRPGDYGRERPARTRRGGGTAGVSALLCEIVEPHSLAGSGAAAGEEPPAAFRTALDALATVSARPEIVLEPIPAPQRLAPWAHALGATAYEPDGDEEVEVGSGRFIVLFDPNGHQAWDGTTRCVGYVSAVTDETLVDDTMFSEVAWSWLTDALEEAGARSHAVGGTVTRTASTRFGDLAGPDHSVEVEIRASWTAEDNSALDRHLTAFLDVLSTAAGLPPPGVQLLGPSGRSGSETL